MDVEKAYQHVARNLTIDIGSFYSSGEQLSLGVGKIYTGVRYPIYGEERDIFVTVSGGVYVLTHECDIDQRNQRVYNEQVLVCPLIPFETSVERLEELLHPDQLLGFLTCLARREVSRIVYLPPLPSHFPFGALLNLNMISSTHVSAFSRHGAQTIAAVTGRGLMVIDQMLENHLFRPKVERLTLTP